MNHYSPGPWTVCGRGGCKCSQVWAKDHPIAIVERGEWGDDYPVLKITHFDPLIPVNAEITATMEQHCYGEIYDHMAVANARLIAASPEMFTALKRAELVLTQCLHWKKDEQSKETLSIVRNAILKAEGLSRDYDIREQDLQEQRKALLAEEPPEYR